MLSELNSNRDHQGFFIISTSTFVYVCVNVSTCVCASERTCVRRCANVWCGFVSRFISLILHMVVTT